MTDEQRSLLESLADPTYCVLGTKWIDAVGAALNEIDRLEVTVEEGRELLDQKFQEIIRLRRVEPPRPKSIVLIPWKGECHAFESCDDAERFTRTQGSVEMRRIHSWTWHPRGG